MEDKQGNNGKNEHTPLPGEIDYGMVFENHAVLMEAYSDVLKNSLNTRETFCRKKFVESHIYKKLRLLRKIYLLEIATLHDLDSHRLTLNKLVENIDKFLSDLFFFPNITFKGVIFIILPILTAIAAICSWLREIWSPEVAEGVVVGLGVWTYLLLLFLGFFLELFLSLTLVSFIDKRLLFIFPGYKLFPEDKLQKSHDRRKRRRKAFLGKEIKETIYEKEDILFESLKAKKNVEQEVDIVILEFIILTPSIYLMFFSLLLESLLVLESLLFLICLSFCFDLLALFFFLYPLLKRRAK